MSDILKTIAERTRRRVATAKLAVPVAMLEAHLETLSPCRDFPAALRGRGTRVIAELKAASPSKGVIRTDFPVAELARELELAGAAALSVLTEPEFFRGRLENLELARREVRIPLLRKDFVVDEYQLLEARVAGADAVLLIAALLTPEELHRLTDRAHRLGLAVLGEAHDEAELGMLLDSGVDMIGVNARDLRTFRTDLATTARLLQRIPPERLPVAESAIRDRADVRVMEAAGAAALLVGETLMRAPHPGMALKGLLG